MASIYKKSRDRGKRNTTWFIDYTDQVGRRRTVRGFSDKSETQRLAAQLEKNAKLIRSGLKSADEDKLITNRVRPIAAHLEEFESYLEGRDVTDKQRQESMSRLRRTIVQCGFSTVADFTTERLTEFLTNLRSTGLSKQTSNHYLKSIKQFCTWPAHTDRHARNPAAEIRRLNVQTDRRHDRRALSDGEFQRLIAAAEGGKLIESISGRDRAMMYLLAASTGYRKGEIGSLSRSAFNLEAEPFTVTVEAAFSKRRRRDTQFLHASTAGGLREWLHSKGGIAPGDLLFPVSGKILGGKERKTHKMMQFDLAAARETWLKEAVDDTEKQQREKSDFLRYKDSRGRFADFHATRHTFITNLSRAGVSPKTVQELARHSDIRLTLGVYTHADLAEKTAAISQLPNFTAKWSVVADSPPAAEQRADNCQCSGSVSAAQTGSDRQDVAVNGSNKESKAFAGCKSQLVAASEVDAICHEASLGGDNIPEWIRTTNLRLRRQSDNSCNVELAKELCESPPRLSAAGQCLSDTEWQELSQLVSVWAKLPAEVRATILLLAKNTGGE